MPRALLRRALPALFGLLMLAPPARAALPKVPEGFEVRLVASVPAVLYPCQVATAPDGRLFVAEDPMDQVGPYEAAHGRILVFEEGKEPYVYADGFRAIFGMLWVDGALYVSHMPFLTVVRDSDGDGKADQRKDLFKDLGPTANKGLNDHIVSGLQLGLDGYLYISVGDKGIPKATGPDGRTIQIIGGGTCRCRPDGTGLEVVSTGTRNHLEANLDDRDNLFTYDNTDDGLGWWTRVTHHIDGGYYGYPYDYHDRPDRMLPRMAEYGGGSPCGAFVYKEDAWPASWRNVGFWAEWGKGKVHAFRFAPDGSTFKIAETFDFAAPQEGLANFRPIDLALSYDGKTLYVADWNMGGWGKKDEKVGRVFAITYTGKDAPKTRPRGQDSDPIEAQVKALDHPSFNERMRAQHALIKAGRAALPAVTAALADGSTDPVALRHLVWTVDGIAGGTPEGTKALIAALRSPVDDVQAQAARALGERGVTEARGALADLVKDFAPVVQLQAVIALGRIKDAAAVPALLPVLAEKDVYLAYAARVALRRIGDWKAAAAGLTSADARVRAGVLLALEQVYEVPAVKTLAAVATDPDRDEKERVLALTYLAQAHRKAKPWDGKWWGTRPYAGKPPAKVDAWEGTPVVMETIRRALSDPSMPVRIAAVAAVKETGDHDSLPVLRARFERETEVDVRREIAATLGALDDKVALPMLVAAVRDIHLAEPVREAALGAVETIGTDLAVKALVGLLKRDELSVERQPRVIAALGKFKAKAAVNELIDALASPAPKVRAAAAEALGKIGVLQGVSVPVRRHLEDLDVEVRKAAIGALGALGDREAIPALLRAADGAETRFEATLALTAMPDVLALQVYLRGLADKSTDLRKASASALGRIRTQAAPVLEQLAARHELSPNVVPELQKIYNAVQPIAEWRLLGPFHIDARPPVAPEASIDTGATYLAIDDKPVTWRLVKAIDKEGQIDLGHVYTNGEDVAAFGYAEFPSDGDRHAQMAVGSDDTLTVWLNGKQVYDFKERRGFKAEDARFDVPLVKGTNRVLIKCGNRGGGWQFAVSVTQPTQYAFLKAPAAGGFNPDTYRAFALKTKGKPARGKTLFADLKGLACIKCHAVGKEGGNVGPELSSVGAKYPKDELIASVLYPSARISSGYEPVVVALGDGRVVTGIIKSESADAIELEDADAKRVRVPVADIDERKKSDVSLMPNGLAEGLTQQDFADLIAYLETLKETPAKPVTVGGK